MTTSLINVLQSREKGYKVAKPEDIVWSILNQRLNDTRHKTAEKREFLNRVLESFKSLVNKIYGSTTTEYDKLRELLNDHISECIYKETIFVTDIIGDYVNTVLFLVDRGDLSIFDVPEEFQEIKWEINAQSGLRRVILEDEF